MTFSLEQHGITVKNILRNPPTAKLYEEGLRREKGTAISSTGALIALSGAKTGRSPSDKRVVFHPDSEKDIWWGNVNIKLDPKVFSINRERAVDYLNTRELLYCVDGYAGWDPANRIKVRVICARAYHALFMYNMLIRPTPRSSRASASRTTSSYNGGRFPANRTPRA
jgi:phosphoenolpyruvate carboxykinase (ATP)